MSAIGRPPWQNRPTWPVQTLKGIVIAGIVFVMLYPFVYVVATSFSGDTTSVSGNGLLPTHYSFAAYKAIFSGNVVLRSLMISIGVTLVGTALSMIITIGMAYGLSRTRDVPGTRFVLYAVLATMLFTSGIIPNYLLMKSLGLLNSYWSLILPGVANAFNMVVLRNFFMEIPADLFDSARIDGASEWQILTRIVLPLSKAVLAVVALFYAVGYWNDFFNALLYLNDSTKWPIQLVLNQYVIHGQNLDQAGAPASGQLRVAAQSIQMAVVVVATVPILVVYPFLQRYFTKGVLTGAIKG
ncbi:carbohydrate ABC transporter permease [Rugosimonospora acidiphila]|uniref:Carbohydrate ABC transporter permease n=1 Tax=Rugosimonospora acidiphila TaxID=556531 RepID=A0ABP9RWR3_9ACTN